MLLELKAVCSFTLDVNASESVKEGKINIWTVSLLDAQCVMCFSPAMGSLMTTKVLVIFVQAWLGVKATSNH